MTKRQLAVLWVGIALAVLMAIYPPWCIAAQGFRIARGYSLLFSPPKETCVDIHRLLIEWGVLAAVITGLLLTLRNKGATETQSDQAPAPEDQATMPGEPSTAAPMRSPSGLISWLVLVAAIIAAIVGGLILKDLSHSDDRLRALATKAEMERDEAIKERDAANSELGEYAGLAQLMAPTGGVWDQAEFESEVQSKGKPKALQGVWLRTLEELKTLRSQVPKEQPAPAGSKPKSVLDEVFEEKQPAPEPK